MAFPWRLLRDAPLATGHIVEDMRLGIDLAIAGHPPVFEPAAEVRPHLPAARAAARGQRTRWEHGHLGTAVHASAAALVAGGAAAAVRPGRTGPGTRACRHCRSWGWCGVAAVVAALTLADSWLPAGLLLVGGAVAAVAGLFAWAAFGRAVLPPAALLAAPVYAVGKLPMYLAFLVRPQRAWVRTPRTTRRP